MATPIEVRVAKTRADLDNFMKLSWPIYRNDPAWVPPLLMELRKVLDRDTHPFHQHAEVEYYIAWRDGKPVGRVAAIVNRLHNEFHEDKLGFFGFFESTDDVDVARALLTRAEQWLRERGMDAVRGPVNFSTNDEFSSPGVLVEGFAHPPLVMMSHNPPYYAALLEQCGYGKAKDLLGYWIENQHTPERLARGAARMQKAAKVDIRPLSLRDFDGEVARLKEIYNSAWEKNWGFVPMTNEEFDFMAKSLRPIVDVRLCMLAEIEGEPAGFILELPDYNIALKEVNGRLFPFGALKFLWYKRQIRQVRVLTLGVKPKFRNRGLETMLMAHLFAEGLRLGFPRGECSWILEDNVMMRRALEKSGFYVYKTYRVYDKPLTPV